MEITPIAHIETDFPGKFGIPRQSGIATALEGRIVFEGPFRNPDVVRGLENVSHIWLLWGFSEVKREGWTATVRPPRLGGNTRLGVFATRSPFRPNPIGLSCVALERVELHPTNGPILHVKGADLMTGTPIYDIKPYVRFTDSHPDADSWIWSEPDTQYEVILPDDLAEKLPENKREALRQVLQQNPVPAYQKGEENREYKFEFGEWKVTFTGLDGKIVVKAID